MLNFLSWLIFVPLQIAFIPFAVLGAAVVAYKQILVSKRLDASGTGIEVLNGRWTMHVLKTDWRSANQIIIADLDGDGRPDIAAIAEHGSYEFSWWRNK